MSVGACVCVCVGACVCVWGGVFVFVRLCDQYMQYMVTVSQSNMEKFAKDWDIEDLVIIT